MEGKTLDAIPGCSCKKTWKVVGKLQIMESKFPGSGELDLELLDSPVVFL